MSSAEHLIRAAAGGVFALASWGGGLLAQAADQLPSWVKAADTPLIVLGLGYAVVHLARELKGERAARIADRDAYIVRMREDAEKGEASREALLRATLDQTNEFKALRREMTRK